VWGIDGPQWQLPQVRKLRLYERLLVIAERSRCCALTMESASPIRDDVDSNQFIHDLEGSPHGAGMRT
jgi:hypothetical protein